MKNWIEDYTEKPVKKFQDGGMASAPQGGAPAAGGPPQGGGDPAAQLEQMLMQYAQTRDPQLAVAIADMLVEAMAQAKGAQGGGQAPTAKTGMRVSKSPVFKA